MKIHRSLTAVAVVAVLALSGCGDDKDNKDSKDATSSESSAPADDKDKAEEGDEVDKDDFLADIREGIENSTTAHMKMTMSVSGQEMTGDAEIDYRTDTPAMAMTLTGGMFGKNPVDMRLIDGIMYMQMPGAGGKFIALDLSDPNSPLAGMGDFSKMMDPGSAFEQYADGLDEVKFVGDEEVNGVDTKHYTVLIDTSKVEAFKDLPAGSKVPDTIEYEMWLDDENRMRRTVVDIAAAGPVTIDVTDYGKDVDIKKPAKSEIMEMPGS